MRTPILAIDPGPVDSAFVVYDPVFATLEDKGIVPNDELLGRLRHMPAKSMVVEMIASYGMPVGIEVFETCVWIGRFMQAWGGIDDDYRPRRLYRADVKLHLCGATRAKDGNVRQALIDKFGPGKDAAIGKKATPGPLYGVAKDVWAALGVAVTADETEKAW